MIHSSSSWVPAHTGSGWSPGEPVFAAGEGGWSTLLFVPQTAGPQSSTSCSWTDAAWKDAAGICPKANLSLDITHLDYHCCLARPYKKAPSCGCFRSTLLCPEPGVSLMPLESGQSGCRMMLFGFGRLRHLGCSPALLKELHKASPSTGKKNKPPSLVLDVLLPFLFLWVETEKEALFKVLECLSPVLNHQKPRSITHFSNCSNQAGNRLQPMTHKFLS